MKKDSFFIDSSRVVRSFGVLFALLSGVLFATFRVVGVVGGMANELVGKALARYSSFTGKMALDNFPEDRVLYAKVKSLQTTVLPALDVAIPVIVTLAVILLVVALVCFILPRQVAQVFVALKIWKGGDVFADAVGNGLDNENPEKNGYLQKFRFSPFHKLIAAAFGVVLLLVVLVVSCSSRGISAETAGNELRTNAENFVAELKAVFNKTKGVDFAPEFAASEVFEYAPKKGGFTATLKQTVQGCPAGSTWKISSESKGIFTKTLSIYRKAPADTACTKIVPNFKSVGK